MTAFEIGLAFQTDKPPGRYGELAAAAEVLGFDVVSVFADLLYQPPLPALLEMARATSRVRLGAACQNPFTQHPYEIAGGLAVLDTVSSGRAYLGLARGRGWTRSAWCPGGRWTARPRGGGRGPRWPSTWPWWRISTRPFHCLRGWRDGSGNWSRPVLTPRRVR